MLLPPRCLSHCSAILLLLVCAQTQAQGELTPEPPSARRHWELGTHWQYGAGDATRAIEHYRQAWELAGGQGGGGGADFDLPGMLNDLAVLLLAAGEKRGAAAALEGALQADPYSPPALSNLGGIYMEQGRRAEALELYLRAVEADPGIAELYHNAGYCYHIVGDAQRSVQFWRRALALKPGLPGTWADIAATQCSEGDLAGSQQSYAEATAAVVSTCNQSQPCFSAYWLLLFQQKLGLVPIVQKPTAEENLEIRVDFIKSAQSIVSEFQRDSIVELLASVGCSKLGYYLIYQGLDNLLPRRALADAFWHVSSSSLRYTAPFLLPPGSGSASVTGVLGAELGDRGRAAASSSGSAASLRREHGDNRGGDGTKIRVGFISAFFYRHSVGLLLGGVMQQLDRYVHFYYFFF
jgi:tetratricopeptide (TPR) repeat protein